MIPSAETWLAGAVRAGAGGAGEAVLHVAGARARARRRVQGAAVLTAPHTSARLIDPLLQRRCPASQAVTVLDSLCERVRNAVMAAIHVRDELRDGQEGIADHGVARVKVTAPFPLVDDRLQRTRVAHLVHESVVTAQGSALNRERLCSAAGTIALAALLAKIELRLGTCSP